MSNRFSAKQGQYLAFVYNYTKIHGVAPAEAEIERYFGVSPPSVHQMILRLEKHGLVSREPGKARTLRVLIDPEDIPRLA